MQKKALIINPYWETLGGGERYTSSFISLLLNSGWKVDIVWPQDISLKIKSRFDIDISQANFVSHSVYTAHYNLAFYVSDGSLPISFARKTIIHFQFPFASVGGKSPSNKIKSRIYKFVCNSEFTKSLIDKEFDIKSTVIYPPVDTSSFKPLSKTKTILYVGRFSQLTQLKNHELLINSFTAIHKKLKGWKLILAGGVGVGSDIIYLNNLLKIANRYPIEIIQNPTFTDLQKLYGHASIFWSASGFGANELVEATKVEHFGITLVEAMASGCVPIISNLGGHKEIVLHAVDGLLVNNQTELESATLEIISNSKKLQQFSTSSLKKSKIFSIQVFNSNFSNLI